MQVDTLNDKSSNKARTKKYCHMDFEVTKVKRNRRIDIDLVYVFPS